MSYSVEDLEVGDTVKKALARAKITNTSHLIEKCGTAKARAEISKATGLDVDVLRKLACMADLLRVPSLGPGSARLLQAAGIESLKVLRKQNAETLTHTLKEMNGRAKPSIVKRLPKKGHLEIWIERAGALQVAVTC